MNYFHWLAILAGGGAIGLFLYEWVKFADKGGQDFKDEWKKFEGTLGRDPTTYKDELD